VNVDNEGALDKDVTGHHGILDAFRPMLKEVEFGKPSYW
jgi:hypothetical protein